MFRSSFAFLFALAVLAFAIGFAAMLREDAGPGISERLDSANAAIADLTEKNDELSEKVRYFSSQLERLADLQKASAESSDKNWDTVREFAKAQEKTQAEIAEQVQRLSTGQKNHAERAEEKLDVLAERFDFGDARMREIADAQEDFAELGEKIRSSSIFKKVGTVDLDDIGRALSQRIEVAMKNRQELTEEQKQKLNLLKQRRSQLQRLTYDPRNPPDPSTGRSKRRELDEAEELLATAYEKEIIELESEVGGLEIKSPSSFDGSDRALQLVLAKAEEEYSLVINKGFHGRHERVLYHDPEISVTDLTSKIVQMIHQLPDDDPILSDL